MSMTDPIANMLATIRNGQLALKPFVSIPSSKLKKSILAVLLEEGYIVSIDDAKDEDGHPVLKVGLKYHDGEAVIRQIKRISKPGRRVYVQLDNMPKVHNGLGVIIVSTSKGVMSDFAARQANIGGELLCSVF
jgi:small subunit ribosomal protein S8